ncbi:hypothetical protein ABK040_005308 [Willaertia magna]
MYRKFIETFNTDDSSHQKREFLSNIIPFQIQSIISRPDRIDNCLNTYRNDFEEGVIGREEIELGYESNELLRYEKEYFLPQYVPDALLEGSSQSSQEDEDSSSDDYLNSYEQHVFKKNSIDHGHEEVVFTHNCKKDGIIKSEEEIYAPKKPNNGNNNNNKKNNEKKIVVEKKQGKAKEQVNSQDEMLNEALQQASSTQTTTTTHSDQAASPTTSSSVSSLLSKIRRIDMFGKVLIGKNYHATQRLCFLILEDQELKHKVGLRVNEIIQEHPELRAQFSKSLKTEDINAVDNEGNTKDWFTTVLEWIWGKITWITGIITMVLVFFVLEYFFTDDGSDSDDY